MRSSAIYLLSFVLVLAQTACDARPAEGGGNPNPVSGAHTIHLTGTLALPMTCIQCHDPTFAVTLTGPLAAANGARGTFDTTNLTCSNVYCHSGGPQLPIGGGTVPLPVWNPPTTIVCGGCHALPGGTIDTTAWHPAVADGVQCGICHVGYSRTSVVVETHVNGIVNVKFDIDADYCAACHGDATRVVPAGVDPVARAAPPVDRDGHSETTVPSVGAHQAHLLPGAAALAAPIACGECHAVPTDVAHVGPLADSPAKLAWGPIASAASAAPAYDRATATCTNYCHGQTLGGGGVLTTPLWTRVNGSQVACGTCHASPPTDAPHQLHAAPANLNLPCSHCHPAGYTIAAVEPEAAPVHVNGTVDTSALFLPDWNPAAVGPTGWTGTSVVGCHGGTRYWTAGLSTSGCF